MGFAGIIRERAELLKPRPGRDALGAPTMEWDIVQLVWCSVSPHGHDGLFKGDARDAEALWLVNMRPCPVAVGDRLDRIVGTIEVREVIIDPATPDRILAIGTMLR